MEAEAEEMTSGSDADFAAGNSVIRRSGAKFRNRLTSTVQCLLVAAPSMASDDLKVLDDLVKSSAFGVFAVRNFELNVELVRLTII